MKIGYINCNYNFNKQNIIKRFLSDFNKIKINQLDNENYGIIINLSEEKINNLKTRQMINLYKKIYNVLYENDIFNVVLDKSLIKNELLKNLLYSENINIIEGKKIINPLIPEILNYIVKQIDIPLNKLEISFLVNKYNSTNNYIIKRISQSSKVVNLVTTNVNKFEKLTSRIFEESGIYIQVSNTNKSILKRSNIICNIDFSQEEIKNCFFPKNSIIVNLNKDLYEPRKSFNGILINDLKIKVPKKYNKEYFNISEVVLCESALYKNLDNTEELIQKFKKEGFKIEYLIGKQSKLNKNEFIRIKNQWRIME